MRQGSALGGPARRHVIAAAAALPLFAIGGRAARAAFAYKFATGQSPSNPINLRLQQAIDRIQAASDGQLQIRLFPNNQLGSDTDQISQVRSGAIEFLNVAASVLATLVPDAALVNVGFAFPDYASVWRAVDGPVGQHILDRIGHVGLVPLAGLANNGFREITSAAHPIATPDDLHGFRIRVPVAPLFTSLFQALGASPTSINFNEVYSALQTHLVAGQENGLVTIDTAKLYEVQSYCAMTNHIWDGFCLLGNPAAFRRLPAKLQDIVKQEVARAVTEQREDETKLDGTLRDALGAKGMQFRDVDAAAFRDALRRTSFYHDWGQKFGKPGWDALQSVVGPLG
jgi:tripartite ATP-independent transporter DctP family solute receptor